jgi:glucan phosphoethanolaminetransferase (alkaline phosphatase superfamily)
LCLWFFKFKNFCQKINQCSSQKSWIFNEGYLVFSGQIMLVAFNIRFCSVEFILFLYFFFLSVCLSLCLSSLRPRRPVVKSAVWSKSQRTFFYFLWTLISFICKQNQGNLLTNKNTFLIPRKWHHFLFCLSFYHRRQPSWK